MGKMIDLTGKTFGRLTVIGPAPCPENIKNTHKYWLCRCDCGNQTVVRGSNLKSNRTKSCGCLKNQVKHGKIKTRLYRIFGAMKTRCYNQNATAYVNYGARGIKVCEAWLDKVNGFQNFAEWSLANGYSDDLSIDRINVNGNYEPSNCRWVSSQTQNCNRRKFKINKSINTGIYKKQNGKYEAYITINKKNKYLGTFASFEEAVEAKQKAERELYPEYAKKE